METGILTAQKDSIALQFYAPKELQRLKAKGSATEISLSADIPPKPPVVGKFSFHENSAGTIELMFEPKDAAVEAFRSIRFCMLRLQAGKQCLDVRFAQPETLAVSLKYQTARNEIMGKASFSSKLLNEAYQANLKIKVTGSFIPEDSRKTAIWREFTLNSMSGLNLFESSFSPELVGMLNLRHGKTTIECQANNDFEVALHCAENQYPDRKEAVKERIQILAGRDQREKNSVQWDKAKVYVTKLRRDGLAKEDKVKFDTEKENILKEIDDIGRDITSAILQAESLARSKVSASFWLELIHDDASFDLEIVRIDRPESQGRKMSENNE